MKWIGQHIYDLIARFRDDVYLEDLSASTETNILVVDSDGKVWKREKANIYNDDGLQISAATQTTANIMTIDADSLTTGSAVFLDVDDILTTASTNSLVSIDYDKNGVTGNLVANSTTGLKIDMDDGATNHAGAIVSMIGAQIDVNSANATSEQKTGLIVNVADDGVGHAANTDGIDMTVMDGGTDMTFRSSAVAGDMCTWKTTTNGQTTIRTLDSDNVNHGANFDLVIDGDISMSSTTNKISETYDYDTETFENQIVDNEGGGEILRYGSGQEGSVGQLHYLHADGSWDETLATGVATGASQLLGIALGSDPGDSGMLLNGYFRVASGNIQGTPVLGAPVYVSDTTGSFDFAAPADNNEFVRIVGYCIDTHNPGSGLDVLIRFKPDNTWVELDV